jgi:hypothetical protein
MRNHQTDVYNLSAFCDIATCFEHKLSIFKGNQILKETAICVHKRLNTSRPFTGRDNMCKKVKLSLKHVVEAHSVVGHRGFHISRQMAVKLCLEWDLNPRFQRSSERRQFMP